MSSLKLSRITEQAAQELRQCLARDDAEQITQGLYYGLGALRRSFFTRIDHDVQQFCGQDSMLLGGTPSRREDRAKLEIEVYQVAVAAVEARAYRYITGDDDWFTPWLTRLRIGELGAQSGVQKRLARYASLGRADRRLVFSDLLVQAFPGASRAPLVLFRLYPLAVQIVTALAFGEPLHANEVRNRQVELLPAIGDCPRCHGAVIENGEECQSCGNPLWKYELLVDPY